MRIDEIMIQLLAKEVLGKEIDENTIKDTLMSNPALVEALYELSKMHDLAHIICLALKNIGVWGTDDIYKKFQRQQTLSVYRYEQLEYELGRVCATLDEAKIPYIPLKGSVIRKLYPEEWMRTSSDVDILVKEENMTQAVEVLCDKCDFQVREHFKNTVAVVSQNGICIEIHHLDSDVPEFEVPEDIWTKVKKEDGYRHVMSGEMLYYINVLHTIKHISSSGCGFKPFLDMYIMEKKFSMNFGEIEAMLEKDNFTTAYKALRKAADVWFYGAESDKLTGVIQKYILMGGVCGNQITGTSMNHRNKGGKLGYVLWLFLPDREEMERRYPILKEQPNKLICYHFKRWGHLIFKGRIKSSVDIISTHMSKSDKETNDLDYMMKQMGLK